MLEVDVIDSGVGIHSDKAKRLFSAFTQADESTSRQYGGTGLGLYISKQLAQMLGGDITLETAANKGSTFSLTLECAQVVVTEQSYSSYDKLADAQDDIPTIPKLCGKVLLAEDSETNRQLISMHINATGADLDMVNDGQQAVEKALAHDYDLILMDIQMPVMDGKEAMSTLAALGFSKPVVALTANVISNEIEEYIEVGFADSLAKPINLGAFYATLSKHLYPNPGAKKAAMPANESLHDNPLMIKLRAQFQSDISQYLQRINNALSSHNWRSLHEVIHIIKGTAGSFGFMPITTLASDIQNFLRQEQYQQAQQLLPKLKELLCEAQNE
jgi:CheY-like chemotaxis protein